MPFWEEVIAIDADISPCPQCESGLVKIQKGEESGMTDCEKSACSNLLLEKEEEEPEAPSASKSIVECIALSKTASS